MLSEQSAYLAGPMEYAQDGGIAWRLKVREALAHLNITCIIPNEEEEHIKGQADLNKLKLENIEEFIRIMREFIKQDLEFATESTYFICKWEGERMSGTVGEAQARYLTNNHAYLITSKPLVEVPGWFLACFTHVFANEDALIDYLTDLRSVENG